MLAVVTLAITYSWREWTRDGDRRNAVDDNGLGAERFVGLLGLAMGGISVVVMLSQWLPTVFLSPCER
jgi:hypothetical protein